MTKQKKPDSRVKRPRQLLQQALMELLAEKNFQAITVQDITERATVNRVTFYAHFEDKHTLLEYTIREMIKQQLHRQLPEDASYGRENLTRLIVTISEFLGDVGHRCPPPHGQLETIMEKQIKAELYETMHRWLVGVSLSKAQDQATREQTAMVTSGHLWRGSSMEPARTTATCPRFCPASAAPDRGRLAADRQVTY